MPTTREIAAMCNVSATTVSMVLNGRTSSISETTCNRVRQAARELDYRISAIPRALLRKRIDCIAIVFPFAPEYMLTGDYFAQIFRGVLSAAHARNQNVTVFTGDAILDMEACIQRLGDGRVDGAVLVDPTISPAKINRLNDSQIKFVVAGETVPNATCVDIDHFAAAYEATNHLIQIGHRKLAMLAAADNESHSARPRKEGFRQALRDHGIDLDESNVLDGIFDFSHGKAGLTELMRRGAPPTAMFCANDAIASGAIAACRELGLSVPGDLSIVGYDDSPQAVLSAPALTSVRQPTSEIGKRAVNLLCDVLDGQLSEPKPVIIPHELILRSSTSTPESI